MLRKVTPSETWTEPPKNAVFLSDCVEGMARLPPACIPLVVTSPPYDRVFEFGGHRWDLEVFKQAATELWRVAVPGGVVCWEIKDQYTTHGFTGTKYRQVLFFRVYSGICG